MPSGTEAGKWLKCNGQYIDPILYPELAALMANTPDYQGIFLRGFGSQTSSHYGVIIHSSGSLGILQGDTIRNAEGSFLGDDTMTGYYGNSPIGNPVPTGVFSTGASYNFDLQNNGSGNGHLINFSLSNVVPTANENRPINKAVNYLIRAK